VDASLLDEATTAPTATQAPSTATAPAPATATATPEPTVTATEESTATATAESTATATVEPTATATPELAPTETQSAAPTREVRPTREPRPTVATRDEVASTGTVAPVELPTETPAPLPTETPTFVPVEPTPTVPVATEELVPAVEPVTRDVVLLPVADTSVTALAPDSAQALEMTASLLAGGSDGAVTYVTFQVEGVGAGQVVSAQLILNGSGATGGVGGSLATLHGVWIDEATMTYAGGLDYAPQAALTVDGAPIWIDWIEPGAAVAIDVTGVVSADGTITFVLTGAPEAAVTIASRETGSPARLVLTVTEEAVS
ncbi:MAG: hypothetical protein M3R06_01375, partial [Chloroflexota bacterium]|nr:hypothetical protein [Chloroflexota bacterium]